ncbi:unnamed protein product [Cyclocybe aegerita]|uniref:GH16 domain-containing protein n=1 Tax=Cyclocybe aegerita TaxID=1973307 RepID=A0A8S0WGB2_CYCAE|nr:unnamed protein product [Cyclocybe aegerita]
MSRPSRRQVYQPTPQYAAVPQSPPRGNLYGHQHQQQQQQPQPYVGGPRPVRSSSANSSNRNSRQQVQYSRNAVVTGVATGSIGAGYGPYSYHPEEARQTGAYNGSRFSTNPSDTSVTTAPTREKVPTYAPQTTTTVPQYLWDKDPDLDDALHNPDPRNDYSFTLISPRGWVNVGGVFVLIVGLLALFLGYPVLWHYTHLPPPFAGFNLGGINGTGQIPAFQNFPLLIDNDTPDSALTRVGWDGKVYDLVFSDEFNTDGRTFYPGDDPFWEAADIHYWPTGDVEWYDPSAITTQGGKLVLTMSEKRSHDLNFESGMLTSWNKLCFNTGYIEVSISMPGSPRAPGLWPGAWTLGNLGRAGYGATTQGMWPYSYDSCDVGTFPNQTTRDDQPAAALGLSFQPGQKLSACTCPGGDHPGPAVNVGRGVPEIDIIETQIDTDRMQGEVSQSFQVAPYDIGYNWDDTSPATTVYNSTITHINSYKGGPFQQAASGVTYIDNRFYGGNEYAPYGFEYWSDRHNRDDGYITWYYDGQPTWTATSASVGPDTEARISGRLISEEPMYVILNLGMSPSFQRPDFQHLTFPVSMYIDYVRIYQRRGVKDGITCNPPSMPTSDYISRHINAYMNPNLTEWKFANYTFPRNSLYDGC